jgi:hypothetical protein
MKCYNDKMTSSRMVTLPLVPYEASIDLNRTAIIIIDMQIDFLEVGVEPQHLPRPHYYCLFLSETST